jgi:hypothetical protein
MIDPCSERKSINGLFKIPLKFNKKHFLLIMDHGFFFFFFFKVLFKFENSNWR